MNYRQISSECFEKQAEKYFPLGSRLVEGICNDTGPLVLLEIRAPFYYDGLTVIPAWINYYTHYNVWDEITYPFLNFNGCTVDV